MKEMLPELNQLSKEYMAEKWKGLAIDANQKDRFIEHDIDRLKIDSLKASYQCNY
jgi:hypothetical protein